VDGEITIGTKLDTDKFDRQISQLEKKMKKEEDKKIIIDAKLGSQQQELDEARQKTDALADAYQRLKEVQNKVSTGQATPNEFTTFQDLQSTYGSLEQLGTQFDKALTKQDAIEQKVAQTKFRYDEINAKVSEYKQKIENVKIEKQVADVEKLKSGFNNVGSSIQGAVKHVARLALGIFGVRSAFMFLRRASSDLASYDQQYATNLEYIRYALTQMIAPVLQWIVNLAAKLLGYINAIMQGWFGINLFSRGSAKNFQKMKAGASGASKAVKEIKKQLAGFDEINMLTDQSDSGAGGGTGGARPDFDLSKMQGDPPKWLQWIIDNKELILGALAGIAAGLIAIKFGASGILALGIGLIVGGIVALIQDIVKFIKDPSWKNFANILRDLAILLAGVAIAMLAVNAANPIAWIILLISIIVLLVAEVIKHWDKIKEVLGVVGNWINEHIIQPVVKFFQELWEKISTGVTNAWNGIKGVLSTVGNWIYTKIVQPVGNFFSDLWNGFKTGAVNAWNFIRNVFSGIGSFFSNIVNRIVGFFGNLGSRAGEAIAGAFKAVVNGVLRAVERILNSPIRAINRLIGVINAVPGVNINRLPTFSLPRLKTGAIVNMPNRGTLVGGGSAIAGEAGREGILPLDDRQAMAELGAEIGRHVLVNLTNITQMNGRVIGRELKQVQSEQEFAFNS